MTILITGGTGKLGFAIAKSLQSKGEHVLLTSRRANLLLECQASPYKSFHMVQFDWYDSSTFLHPFEYCYRTRCHRGYNGGTSSDGSGTLSLTPIDRVFLVCPISIDMLELHIKPFVELAIKQGVKRFVFVSGTPAERGEPGLGEVHEYIAGRGVDWCVLRPSWYMENFATNYLVPIRDHGVIPSIAEDGRVPFVSIDDIVKPACDALVDEKSHNREHKIVGPELLTYDEAAGIFSVILDRPIKHRRERPEKHMRLYQKVGLDIDNAELLTKYELGVAQGADEVIFANEDSDKIVGRVRLEKFVGTHKELWR